MDMQKLKSDIENVFLNEEDDSVAVEKILSLCTEFTDSVVTQQRDAYERTLRDAREEAYIRGVHMERKLMRIRLGLAVEGDS